MAFQTELGFKYSRMLCVDEVSIGRAVWSSANVPLPCAQKPRLEKPIGGFAYCYVNLKVTASKISKDRSLTSAHDKVWCLVAPLKVERTPRRYR